jgi:hypothetical protein
MLDGETVHDISVTTSTLRLTISTPVVSFTNVTTGFGLRSSASK